MSNINIIQGKYCCLNFEEYLINESWANELVCYFDNKLPLIVDLLKYSKCPARVYIFSRKDNCAPGKYDNDKMQFTANAQNEHCISRGNKGFLVHEAAHFVQNYGKLYFDPKNMWAAEGIADYARIKLGWDNTDKLEYPCQERHLYSQCSKCAADFLHWLNNKYGNNDLVVNLNKSLQDDVWVDDFFSNTLNTTVAGLYLQYQSSLISAQ